MPGGLHSDLVRYYAEAIWQELVNGFGKDLPGPVDYDTPDGEMLLHLKRNVYQFSGAKNYAQMKAMTEALIGPDDKLRTKSEYFREAHKINNQQVHAWLDAESDLAIASGQMASRWLQIQEEKDIFPYLYYDAILDKGTTDMCRNFDGILLPVDHSFWDQYFPPNHFRCRSDVQQRDSGRVTDASKIVYPAKFPPMFKVNLAKRHLAFPPDHPYWKDIPEDVKKHAMRLMPYDEQFESIEKKGQAWVRKHIEAETNATDYNTILIVALEKMKQGSKVDILPAATDPELRAILFPDAKKGRSPDMRIDGILTELKRVSKIKHNTIKHAITTASHQADHTIIVLPDDMRIEELRRIAKRKFMDHAGLQLIEFIMGDRAVVFQRGMLIK